MSAAHQPRAALGRPRLHLRSTDSTNERARALAATGAPHGTLVTAGEQSAGRGRQGRSWSAPAGSSLLMSLLVRTPPRLLPLIAAVAVCEATGQESLIKWPNDIVLAEGERLAKLAGILVEGRVGGLNENWAVVGIGVNVAVELDTLPPELQGQAATVGGSAADIEPLLAGLLGAFERLLAAPAAEVLEAWSARDALRGRRIEWGSQPPPGQQPRQMAGVARGIDGDGRLVVSREEGGQTALSAGEVHLRQVG